MGEMKKLRDQCGRLESCLNQHRPLVGESSTIEHTGSDLHTIRYSHKEEACAHMVWNRAHPDVSMFLEVLGCDHCDTSYQMQSNKYYTRIIQDSFVSVKVEFLNPALRLGRVGVNCGGMDVWAGGKQVSIAVLQKIEAMLKTSFKTSAANGLPLDWVML